MVLIIGIFKQLFVWLIAILPTPSNIYYASPIKGDILHHCQSILANIWMNESNVSWIEWPKIFRGPLECGSQVFGIIINNNDN